MIDPLILYSKVYGMAMGYQKATIDVLIHLLLYTYISSQSISGP